MCRFVAVFIVLILVIMLFVAIGRSGIRVSIQGPDDSTQKVTSDTPTPVHRNVPTAIPTDTPTAIPTDTPTPVPTDYPTPVPTDIPTAIPTYTSSTNYDSLPDTVYYCNRVHYLGGRFPQHFYVGHCLIKNVEQFSMSISDIAGVISVTLCEENVVCSGIINGLARLIKGRIDHIYDEDNQCGQRGVYVHLFDAFFTTHPVC